MNLELIGAVIVGAWGAGFVFGYFGRLISKVFVR